ncbi:hypothetical protein BCR33DRAFT_831340 [Rhizoclosmatium globosum]|uniref:Uncharacterized protein n=1 Tax=Rhizoclosmatium globosum TaxID=329046 RepID=A0A1Y2BW62_9FUNG|nr:hypothetical protein BCR33DRAFT_831340 [Rhizoclosmatium globosum]|eukprot:ORY38991.1 hypothetical protein BCR33DRAFT_831340 [Rhizoclosmatium globosum]
MYEHDDATSHQCNCLWVDDRHKRFICMFNCTVGNTTGGYETFLKGLSGDEELMILASEGKAWTESYVFHDIASFIASPKADLYQRAVKFFGSLMLDMVDPKVNETPLSQAIKSGNLCFIQFLVMPNEKGRIMFSRRLGGDTYLHIAAKTGNYDVIKLVHSIFKSPDLAALIDEANEDDKSAYEICIDRAIPNAESIFVPPVSGGEVLNILTVGSSQVGKSAFIKYLHEYNGITLAQNIQVGNGTTSCTTKVSQYSLSHKYKEFFPLIGSNGKRVLQKVVVTDQPYQPKSSRLQLTKNLLLQGNVSGDIGNVDDLYSQANLDIHEVHYPRLAQNIRIIDTPGIGDTDDNSNGKDESHVMGILDYLDAHKISTIHAVILLIKPDTATQEIKERIYYYYKLFNIGTIYIVFTHYNKDAILKDFDDGINIQAKRVSYLEMCNIMAPPYVFNVSVIPPSTIRPNRRDYVTEFLTNCEINKLFSAIIRSTRHINVADLKFEKTKHMQRREKAIVDFINGRLIGLEDGIRQFDAQAADEAGRFMKLHKELSEKREEIERVKDELREKNNNKLYLLTEKVFDENWYWFWSRPERVFVYDSQFPIEKEETDVSAWKGVIATVIAENDYKLKVTIQSKWYTKQDAVVKVFTKNRFFYEAQIKLLTTRLASLNKDLVIIEGKFSNTDAKQKEIQSLSLKEQNRIRKFTAVAQFLSNKDISRTDYRLLTSFYNSIDSVDDAVVDKIYERRSGVAAPNPGINNPSATEKLV